MLFALVCIFGHSSSGNFVVFELQDFICLLVLFQVYSCRDEQA